ncbi:hypothetical protein ABQJ54_18670 [Rhodanobacter sp. Si-c]|uniref:Uncharacterized protein n=1 Tax=Rhodanobacter lycopersici TaxID=3162487 RepID=A0ABV3QJR8_9GAMM
MIRTHGSSTPQMFVPAALSRGGLLHPVPLAGTCSFSRQGLALSRALIGPAA